VRKLLNYNPETGELTWKAKYDKTAGYINNQGYREIWIDGKAYMESILAWLIVYGEWPNNEINYAPGPIWYHLEVELLPEWWANLG
jgi:hypothetical protein